jgi:hypothetical protein
MATEIRDRRHNPSYCRACLRGAKGWHQAGVDFRDGRNRNLAAGALRGLPAPLSSNSPGCRHSAGLPDDAGRLERLPCGPGLIPAGERRARPYYPSGADPGAAPINSAVAARPSVLPHETIKPCGGFPPPWQSGCCRFPVRAGFAYSELRPQRQIVHCLPALGICQSFLSLGVLFQSTPLRAISSRRGSVAPSRA